jgi:DNA-binding MarR family transcriptional regulator
MKISDEVVLKQLNQVINKILFLKKKSFFEFEGVKFYPSEIHLLLVAKEKTATNATSMAEELGITKGAVSQTVSRLEQKGVLTKTKDPYHKNELTLNLTTFGKEAFRYYRTYAARLAKRHERYLSRFTGQQKATIFRFLGEVEKFFDELS